MIWNRTEVAFHELMRINNNAQAKGLRSPKVCRTLSLSVRMKRSSGGHDAQTHRSTLAVVALCMSAFVASSVSARDDGRYANSALRAWFDQLASGRGLCCSFADGVSIQDVDWGTQDGRYRVRLHGEWIFVPDGAVVTEPNRFGPAVVWPYMDADGAIQIRCFLPGAGA